MGRYDPLAKKADMVKSLEYGLVTGGKTVCSGYDLDTEQHFKVRKIFSMAKCFGLV